MKLFTDEFFNENHADFRYYVTCFSYQNDLLSQWRGYADDGRGAAIGFDLDVLKEVVTFLRRFQSRQLCHYIRSVILKQSREKLYIR